MLVECRVMNVCGRLLVGCGSVVPMNVCGGLTLPVYAKMYLTADCAYDMHTELFAFMPLRRCYRDVHEC